MDGAEMLMTFFLVFLSAGSFYIGLRVGQIMEIRRRRRI